MSRCYQFFYLRFLLSGCLRTRDMDRKEDVGNVLPETRKVVIVLSKCYIKNNMEECQKIIRYANPDGKPKTAENFIIPIVRDIREPPECLNNIEHLDFSVQPYDIEKLHIVLCEKYACPISEYPDNRNTDTSETESDTESTDSSVTASGEQKQDLSWSEEIQLDLDPLNPLDNIGNEWPVLHSVAGDSTGN